VLLHSNVSSLPFETTLQASTNYDKYAAPVPGPGPRSLRRDSDLQALARQLHESQTASYQAAEEHERAVLSSTTVTKSSFVAPDPSVWDGVSRIPRGRNGGRVIDQSVQHLTRGEVDSIDQMTLRLMGNAPVTRYSHAIATGAGLDFPTTASDMANPFARSSAFTNEITDSTKRHGEATEPGQDSDERIGTNVHQRAALRRLVQLCRANPSMVTQLFDSLVHAPAESGNQVPHNGEFVELSAFRAVFASLARGGAQSLSEREVIHVFMYFDTDSIGAIRVTPFLEFCDREVSDRPSSTSSTSSASSSCILRI
jgi:hypothetical protein